MVWTICARAMSAQHTEIRTDLSGIATQARYVSINQRFVDESVGLAH
jgi:hypothetical protein